jgi:hypothetical protein
MSAGIQHLLKGGRESNRVGEGRVDKIETDRFNSIVERISGVNPSKLAAEVTKKPVMQEEAGQPPQMPAAHHAMYGAGPAADLAAARRTGSAPGNQQVEFLAHKVALLEQKLAKYETFNGDDNDVVSTSSKPAQGPSNRGPDSTVFARDIDPKKAKRKDPADGKPDKPKVDKTPPEGQMPAEHMNILGISMSEWREMTGLKSPPVDLTIPKPGMTESFEDEVEGEEVEVQEIEVSDVDAVEENADERQLWADFLGAYNTTPEELAEFVEVAERNKDIEALVAVQELEDEFVESMGLAKSNEDLGPLWAQWLEDRGLSVETFDALVESASDEDLEQLEALQAMFEAEFKVGPYVTKTTSVAGSSSAIKPASKTPDLNQDKLAKMKAVHDKFMASKTKTEDDDMDEEDAFECDDDGNGHPNMKDPGWAKAMKRWKLATKKGGGIVGGSGGES